MYSQLMAGSFAESKDKWTITLSTEQYLYQSVRYTRVDSES